MKVSVIVCTHDPKMINHFKDCVNSLFNQTYDNIEIVVVVDGDRMYYEKIKDLDGVKVHLNEKNLGLLRSRNKGVEIATGDVVAFIDDDAVADKNWVKEIVKTYRDGVIAVGGKILPLWINKKPRWFPEEFYWMIGATYLGFPEKVTEVRNTFGSNLSFRKDVFVALGGFNPKMGGIKGRRMLQGGETELCERMRKKFGRGVVYNPNAIVYHKVFPTRTKFSFLIKRAFWQGFSKAVMQSVIGNIQDETNYLKYLVFNSTPARVRKIIMGSSDDLLKLALSWFFTFVVGLGYIWGKLKIR